MFFGVKSMLEIFWGILKIQQFFGVLKISVIGLYVYSKYDILSELNSCVRSQELEVRSLYHLYSIKIKSSRCHYVVMTL